MVLLTLSLWLVKLLKILHYLAQFMSLGRSSIIVMLSMSWLAWVLSPWMVLIGQLCLEITEGTVIFTAHGVSPDVKCRARERGLTCIDATCPDVTKTHELVVDLVSRGYYILYIGKKGHPEPEGVIGEIPGHVSLIETEADVDALQLTPEQEQKLAVSTQTTLSQWDTQRVVRYIKQRYQHAEIHIDICAATQTRQEAVAEQARSADLTIVVGDVRSNNTNRLVQVSEELANVPARRIADLSQLDIRWLKGKKRIAVTRWSFYT